MKYLEASENYKTRGRSKILSLFCLKTNMETEQGFKNVYTINILNWIQILVGIIYGCLTEF